jgi:hypothetical protein
MTTIVTNPVTLGAGVPDATTIETDLKFLIIQTIASTLTFQEAPLALVKSNLLSGALAAANNLSDLADDLVARSNLDARNFYYSSGTAAPSGTLGIVNDIAINDNGIIYEKTAATTWTTRVDIATSAELTTAIANHVASSDPHPLYLTQTEGDVRYAPLGESPGSGARYLFDVSTAIGSIGTGEIRFNNTVSASITSIAIYETDRNGGAMATFLDLISIGSKLQVSFDASEEIYSWFNVTGITDNGAFRTFNVTHIASAGTRANGEVTLGIFGSAGSSLTVREVDGTPSIAASVIEFPNGSLTDQGGGVARLTLSSGGASGLQYTYNDADPPTASGQIRTLQASLNVATAVAINAADVNGDSATDITARLKTGAIFTIAKDASNYVRLEATADYSSGSVAVVVRAEQGTILTGETVYLDIISDSPSVAVGGTGLTPQVITTSQTASDGIAYICDGSNLIEVTLPTTGSRFAVSNRGTGGFKIRNQSGVTGQLGTQLLDSAIKYIGNTNQFAYVEFFRLSNRWLATADANVNLSADIVNNAKSLIRFNNAVGLQTAIDETDLSRVITLNGTAAIVSAGKFGNAARLNGAANDGISGLISAPLGSSDFCIEWWMATTSAFASWNYLTLSRGNVAGIPATSDGNGIFLSLFNLVGGSGTADNEAVQLQVFGISTQFGPFAPWYTGNLNNFIHVAIVRNGTTFSVYTNGVLTKTRNLSSVASFSNQYNNSLGNLPWNFRIGGNLSGANVPDGKFDEWRVTIGDPVYTAPFTPPTTEFVYP